MKKFALLLALALIGTLVFAESAAEWGIKNGKELEQINDAALETIAKDNAAMDKLITEAAKPAYTADPLAITRVAALSQYVARPAGAAWQKVWAEKLLAAAKSAQDHYVAIFLLDQLRWAGNAAQAGAVKSLAAAAKEKAVKDMAQIVVNTLETTPEAATASTTPFSEFRKTLLAMPENQRTTRLLTAFDGADNGIAGAALRLAITTGGADATALWAQKLTQTTNPQRKAMLLDMLGTRGDSGAQGAIAACLADPDPQTATAAHSAFLRLNPATYAGHLPTLLTTLTPEQVAPARNTMRQLDTTLIRAALPHAYKKFSPSGKLIALEIFKERRMPEAAPLAIAALDDNNPEGAIAAWRLMREVAGIGQAEQLVAKALVATGRVAPEAQNALAVAARRDNTGAYAAALVKALTAATTTDGKSAALEAAGRIGGSDLLKSVAAATADANDEVATAATRALAAWPDTSALPPLFKLALTAPDKKRQILAMRGAEKLASNDPVGTMMHLEVWKALRNAAGNEEHKKAIDELFKKRVNVALNKPVTTDVPTESNHVPANLVDGTLENAWYGGASPARAVIDLGSEIALDTMHVTFYSADNRTYTFTLELSRDGKTWQQVTGNEADPKPATAEGLRTTFTPTVARYARLNVLKNSANPSVHVLELQLFSAAQ